MGALIINSSTIAAARFFNHCSSSSSLSTTTTAIAVSVTTPHFSTPTPISSSRLHIKLAPKCFNAHQICVFKQQRGRGGASIIVKASSGIDGSSLPDAASSPQEDDAAVPPIEIQNLPLESKQQLMLEQKLRMKLAKKIRLRRKRLVRKRQMRKKGRWPPSKVNKNKNV